jgi:hypothetical protein
MLIIALLAFLGFHNSTAPDPKLPNKPAIEAPAEATAIPITPAKDSELRPEMPG